MKFGALFEGLPFLRKKTDQNQITQQIADLERDRKNIEMFRNSSDSTGATRSEDVRRLAQINESLERLRAQLPQEQPQPTLATPIRQPVAATSTNQLDRPEKAKQPV